MNDSDDSRGGSGEEVGEEGVIVDHSFLWVRLTICTRVSCRVCPGAGPSWCTLLTFDFLSKDLIQVLYQLFWCVRG